MTTQYRKVTQVKLDIKQIIDNLQLLECCNSTPSNLQDLKTNTENLLIKLECLPLERLNVKLKKRKRNKHNKKLQKLKNREKYNELENEVNTGPTTSSARVSREPKRKSHNQLRSLKECQRFLQTFELLQQLHLIRGQNSSETYKFSVKLRQLKSVWNYILQEKLQETSSIVNIQQQWTEVLFGAPEKKYFQERPDLQNFISKRDVWDSYIDSRYGSSIPIGWIIPKLEVNEQWQPYLTETNYK